MSQSRIVFGFHAVTVLLRQRPQAILELHAGSERSDGRMRDLLKLAGQKQVRVMAAQGDRLDGLAGHGRHQGVVALVAEAKAEVARNRSPERLRVIGDIEGLPGKE